MTLYTETQKAAAREYANRENTSPWWLGVTLGLVAVVVLTLIGWGAWQLGRAFQ